MGVMDRYEEKKKKPSTSVGKSTSGGVAERFALNQYYKTLDIGSVDESYINTFANSTSDFFDRFSSDSFSYGEATKTISDLRTRYDTIQGWLSQNKSKLDESSYSNVSSYLNDVKVSLDSVNDYYSQWETEDAYNQYMAAQKDKAEKLTFDLNAGKKELDDITAKKKHAAAIRSTIDTLNWQVNEGDSSTETQLRLKALQEELKQYDGIDALYTQKTQYYNQAKHLQGGEKLKNDAVNASDFEEYAQKGAEIKNPSATDAEKGLNAFGWKPFAEKVNNEVTYSRDNWEYIAMGEANGSDMEGNSIYRFMEDEEVKIYNYYLAKYGKDKADEYLYSIGEDLNARQGGDWSDNAAGNLALQYLLGAAAGLDQFSSGVKAIFSDEDYINTTALQYAGSMVREDLADAGPQVLGSSLGQIGYDIVNTTANMAPSILASTIVSMVATPVAGAAFGSTVGTAVGATAGQLVGAGVLGASAGGNAYAEKLNAGYSKEQAAAYGKLVGASEAGLEFLMGGIGKLGGKVTGKSIEAIANNIDNALGRVALKWGMSMLSEGAEEYLQEVLTPWYENIVFNMNNDVKLLSQEALYAGLLGALSAGVLESVDVVSGDRAMTQYGKELQKDGLSVERLKDLGQTFAADTVAYKLAGKVDEKTSAYTLARLFNEVNAQLTEQNKADIVKSLERKGIATAHAEIIANQLAAAVDGAEFGAAQRFVLEHNEDIAKTFYDVIVNANSTVNQRRVQSTTSLFDLANEQAQAYVQQKYAPTAMQKKSAEEYKADAVQRVKDMTARPATESYTPSQDEAVGPLSMEELARRVAAAKSMTAADVAAAKVADAEKKAMGSFTASDSGKAVQKSTGTEIGKMEIVSTEGKKLKLKTEDGKVVDGNDVSFPSKGVAMVYNAVKEMGVSPVVAQSLVDNYDGGDGMVYAADVKLAYQYGKMNFPKSYLEQLDIKPYQAEHAYKLGRSDAKAAKAKTRRTTQYKRGSLIYESEIDEATLTPRKKASLDGLKMLADLSSLNIHVFESTLTKDGFHFTAKDGTVIGANGVYKTGTNDIWVDINSGNFGQGLAIHTAAHEISHYIKQWSPVKWQAMADFILEQYGEKGVRVDAMLQFQMDKVRKSKPNLKDNALMDEAYEELVSDALSEMLVDGKVVEKMQDLKRKDHQLWEKIKEAIKDLLDRWGLISKEYEGVIPEAGEAQALRQMDKAFKKLQDMYAEAFADADANFSEAEVSMDTAPVEASVKNSFRSLAEAAGFAALELEDGTRVFLKDRQRVSKVTLNDIENSPIGAMINFSLEMKDITAADAKRQKEMFRDLCNMAIKTGDFGMTMQFAGSAVFTGMKANADKQYGTTYDFPSICTKTQAVIDAMSARMVKLGRGLSSDEIVEIYREVFASGNPVPCPECYVFSRWIGIGGLLDNIKSYQETYGKMSVQEAAAAYDKLHKQIEEIAEEKGISFGKAKGKLASELQKEYNKLKERIEKAQNQGERVKPADEKRLADLEPMMTTVKALTWLENVYFADEKHTKVNKNFRVPDNILFDLNNGEAFATQYKEAWAFRTTQGAGYGKAITPYAEARLGEGILVTNNTTNTIKGKAKGTLNNYFLEQKGTMDDKAVAALKKARAKQKNQAFIGGQRFQSTSDARYENASDYLLAALEMQAMGGMVQVYTKVDGAVPAFSAWGFSINQSLMPLGGGLDADGNVRDTSTGGMNPKVAFRNRDKHETAGTITIGVNDNHIRAMFAQWERDFIIPYHASGGKATVVAEFRDIQEKREAKGAKVRSTDYSRTQSDKVLSDEVLRWMGKSDEDIRQIHAVRDARIAILTGKSPDMEVVRGNRFLSTLYDKVRVKGGEWYGVTLAKGKVEGQIFPNEFWDQSVSYENSAKVTEDYLAYCEDLGVLHRFSGMIPQNGILRPATGYSENGERVQLTDLAYKYKDGEKTAEVEPFFWKVLTDRRMYDNSRHYLPQKRVTLNDTTTETVTTFATGNYGRQYDAGLSMETAARLADAKLSDRVTDKETLAFLNAQIERGEYITTYKSMRLDGYDAKGNPILHSPMAAEIKGKFENDYELGQWYQAAEHPELIKFDKKNGLPYFELDKGVDEFGNELGKVPARYNPYEHSSNYVINDQFKTAFKRPNLVVVEMRIPLSETTSGYQAQYAKDPVGWSEWKKGDVASALAKKGKERMVFLSRWSMPVRILSDAEVAKQYKELLSGTGVKVPNNVVTPTLLKALEEAGVDIDSEGISRFEAAYAEQAAKREAKKPKTSDIEQSFGITSVNDYVGVQKAVVSTLENEGFFDGVRNITTNLASGMVVEITKDGIRETLGPGKRFATLPRALKDLKLATLRSLPEIIASAEVDTDSAPNIHAENSKVKYAYLKGETTIDGTPYEVTVTVRRSQQKNKFWVHEVRTEKKKQGLSSSGGVSQQQEYNKALVSGDRVTQPEDGVKEKLSDRDTAPTFYSHMARVVDDVKQEKLGAASVVSMLRGKGVKAEEIKWSGIEAWLEGKKSVTKAELQEFIAGSMLQIEEETLSDEEIPYTQEQLNQIAKYEADRDAVAEQLKSEWKRIVGTDIPIVHFGAGLESAVMQNLSEANATKKNNSEIGHKYNEAKAALQKVIEDSDDDFGYDTSRQAFREAVRNPKSFMDNFEMTSFQKGVFRDFIKAKEAYRNADGISDQDTNALIAIAANADRLSKKISDIKAEHYAEVAKHLPKWGQYKLKGGSQYREVLFKLPGANYTNDAMYAHWDNRNGVLAHARIQDMNTTDGKMLFVEEIQSDWHNEGRKNGYNKYTEAEKAAANKRTRDAYNRWVETGSEVDHEEFLRLRRIEMDMGVFVQNKLADDAPFRDTYQEFVMKRLIRMAAEGGYDSIGWTTASIQSTRWSPEFGEGYRIEYDLQIPKFMDKYGKKWGAKVGKAMLDQGWSADAERIAQEENFLANWNSALAEARNEGEANFVREQIEYTEKNIRRLKESGETVWSMPITDAMKESVLYEGQALYSERDTDSVSNRSLLANAFMDVAQNDTERSRITEYNKKVSLMEEQEKKLQDIRGQLRDLSFAPGPRDQAKIRKLREEATKISNRIDIYDKQLLRLEASAPLMAVLEREKKLAYSRASQKWADRMETARTGRSKTEMRHKVQKVVGELNNLLLHGSKDKHVMIGLQKATAEALNAINMDTVAAEERLAKIQAKIDKSTNPAEIAQLRQTYARIEEQGMNMTARLTALKNAYEDIKDSGDPLVANAYHPEIEDRIKNLRKLVGDTPLRNMSMEQLEFTYDTYRMVLTTIRNANKAFKNAKGETIAVLGNRSMEEIATVGGKKTLAMKAMQGPLSFAWSGMKPVYAFKAIGSNTLSEMFGQIRAGEDTWAVDVSDAKEFYREKAKQYHYDSWDLNKQYSFTSKTGKEFKLTVEQIMSLYAYSKRKQADAHLDKGGFVFDDAIEVTQKKHGIPVKYTVKTADAHNLSAETLQAICKTLTKEQAQFVDEMQEYLSTTMGEKGNEVSLAMYGVKLFKEKFYFPLKSAKQYMFEQNEVAGEVKIKNSGFSKETVQHASNPVILSNFTDVWANHVNDMAMYHAFVLPLEDFNRVFNYKTPNSANMDTESVKMYLQNAYGRQPEQYIKSLLTDLNGGARSDPNAGIINKGIGMFKKAAVFASLSVVIQQPSAIARAAAYIDTKYFVGKPSTKAWDEVKKYAPVAIIKEMGYFDTNMGVSTVDFIKAKEYEGTKAKMKALVTDSQFRDEALSKAPAVADELAWCQIWEAVKKEVTDKQGLSGEELLQAAGKRFTEVIVNTQVYDSVLSRSGLMRSKDTGMKMATAFMAEPTTSLNMITDAIIQGKRGDKSYARKAIGSVVASMIINSILVSFVYAGRDDDEDKTYLEKYAGTLTGELIDSFNPLQLIPFVKDIVSIMQGYDVERSDMAVVTDLYKAWKNLSSDKRSVYRKVEDFGGAVAAIFGLPVKNIMRDVRGIYNTVMSFFNGEETTGRGVGEAVRAAVTGKERSNSDQLYSAMVNGDRKQAERIKSRFKDERSVVYAIRDGLVANDKRITKAAEARVAGNQTEYMRLAKEIVKEGHFSQDDVVRAINYVTDKLRKGETETSSAVSSPDTFKMEDYFNEVVSRDQAEANVVKREIIAGLVADGKTEEEAEKSFNNSFKNSAVKTAFEAGDVSESEAIAMLRDYGGFDENAAKADVQYWAFKQDYPDIYVDDSWFDSYYEYVADVNIPIDVYMNYRNTVKSITGDGKKARRMAVIDSLPLTYAQKDALYYSEGWTASTIYEAPWH